MHAFFQLAQTTANERTLFFALKLAAGFALWAIYTYYYKDRGSADIWKYFDDSAILHRTLREDPATYFRLMSGLGTETENCLHIRSLMQHWDRSFDSFLFNDSHTIIRFNTFVRLISGDNYHIHTLVMCMLSFVGLTALYKIVQPLLADWKKLPAWIIFLFPSVVFWGSGVLKEGLLLFAFGLLIYQSILWARDGKRKRLFWIFVFAALVFVTKFYVLAALFPVLLSWIIVEKRHGRNTFATFGLVLVLFVGTGLLLSQFADKYNPAKIIAVKQNDFLRLAGGGTYLYNDSIVVQVASKDHAAIQFSTDHKSARFAAGTPYTYWRIENDFSDTMQGIQPTANGIYTVMTDLPRAGSLMDVKPLEQNLRSVLFATPAAAMRALIRPYPWEVRNPLLVLPFFENVLILVLFILALFFFRREKFPFAAWLFCIGFAVLLLSISGLTTPVLGALVRYRLMAFLMLAIGLCLCINRQKLVTRFPKFEKWC
ncbi:MAG: hypothetical protein ACRCYO_04200 [Bacteroidia bacterium]